jgi:hypothetical protein
VGPFKVSVTTPRSWGCVHFARCPRVDDFPAYWPNASAPHARFLTDEGGSASHRLVGPLPESPRTGAVLEVMVQPDQLHYRVRWDQDGHGSVFTPSSDVTFNHAIEQSYTERESQEPSGARSDWSRCTGGRGTQRRVRDRRPPSSWQRSPTRCPATGRFPSPGDRATTFGVRGRGCLPTASSQRVGGDRADPRRVGRQIVDPHWKTS